MENQNAAQPGPSAASIGSATRRQFATVVTLLRRIDGWNNDIQSRLARIACQNADEAKGKAVTDAMEANPGYSILGIQVIDVTDDALECKVSHLARLLDRAQQHFMHAPKNQSAGEAESRRRFQEEVGAALSMVPNTEQGGQSASVTGSPSLNSTN